MFFGVSRDSEEINLLDENKVVVRTKQYNVNKKIASARSANS
ncbi:hypothetical protein ACPC0Q_07520 [Bacillus bombysepticus]